DFPGFMDIQTRAFDQLVGQSDAGLIIALDIRYAGLSIRDLVVVVKASGLHDKALIASALETFVFNSREAARALVKLSTRIYGTVDDVTAANDYAMHMLQTAGKSSGNFDPEIIETLQRAFYSSSTALANAISSIMDETSRTATILRALEEDLYRIQSFCVEEESAAKMVVEGLLADIWTILGGNRARLAELAGRVGVLRDIDKYRRLAVAHTSSTIQTLWNIQDELEQLNHKISSSTGTEATPLEVHIASISNGIMRLKEK
ncbi:hypothetical protein C8Q76DRAFT_567091, partial [Earliella scabrosa]